MNMELTEIKVFPVNEERLKAYVTITLNDCFVIRDLKIIQGHSGLFVAMPSNTWFLLVLDHVRIMCLNNHL